AAFTKTYNNLPMHNMIYFTLNIMYVDDWQDNSVWVQFNTQAIYLPPVNNSNAHNYNLTYTDTCGSGHVDMLMRHYASMTDGFPSLTVTIGTDLTLDGTQSSVAFRDLTIILLNSTTSLTSCVADTIY